MDARDQDDDEVGGRVMPEQTEPRAGLTGLDRASVGFVRALSWVLDGERVTRVEWGDPGAYVLMHLGTLCVRHGNGQVNSLILRDVDLYATDWRVV